MIPSYGKVYNVGHAALQGFFSKEVYLEEKIDGSQFSFALLNGSDLFMRSRGAVIDPDSPPKMFAPAVDYVKSIQHRLIADYIYRGEVLTSKKHNALCYDRLPKGYVVLWDIELAGIGLAGRKLVEAEANRLGFDHAPLLGWAIIASPEQFKSYLSASPLLGGPMIEGIVAKRHPKDTLYGPDGKVLSAKYVQEAFKEVHSAAWSRGGDFRPYTGKDIIAQIGDRYRSEARWLKAIQHLQEAGQLTSTPKDIQFLIEEIPNDIWAEEEGAIVESLVSWAKKDLKRQWVKGFAQFYKDYLLKEQFKDVEDK